VLEQDGMYMELPAEFLKWFDDRDKSLRLRDAYECCKDITLLPGAPPAGNPDGPWTGVFAPGNPPQSVNHVISRSPHQCLIAEIRYDDTPIPPCANSATTDKLAQRNIAWIDRPNPGVDISRRMPHPIEVRTTPTAADTPDELMIFCGNTPKGSTGSLYLPGVNAADILSLANWMYPWHQLTVADANTIQCPAYGTAFVPIPAGTARLAGLLTVDLPLGITKGDIYEIFVRQLTEGLYVPPPPIQRSPTARALPAGAYAWRNAFGAFKFSIVIKTKQQILFHEERLRGCGGYSLRYLLRTGGIRYFSDISTRSPDACRALAAIPMRFRLRRPVRCRGIHFHIRNRANTKKRDGWSSRGKWWDSSMTASETSKGSY
jgi:hypothetical protein